MHTEYIQVYCQPYAYRCKDDRRLIEFIVSLTANTNLLLSITFLDCLEWPGLKLPGFQYYQSHPTHLDQHK